MVFLTSLSHEYVFPFLFALAGRKSQGGITEGQEEESKKKADREI